jgi:hypothetical protein
MYQNRYCPHTQLHLAIRTGALPSSAKLAEAPPTPTPRRLSGNRACQRIRWVSVSSYAAVPASTGKLLPNPLHVSHTPCQAYTFKQHMRCKVFQDTGMHLPLGRLVRTFSSFRDAVAHSTGSTDGLQQHLRQALTSLLSTHSTHGM